MKNTRQTLFSSILKDSTIQTASGSLEAPLLSYAKFNEFAKTDAASKNRFTDFTNDSIHYRVVLGLTSGDGRFKDDVCGLKDFNIYGSTIYSTFKAEDGISFVAPEKQRGLSFPLANTDESGIALKRRFLVREKAASLNPSALTPSIDRPSFVGDNSGWENAITYIFKIRSNPTNAKSLFQIGEPGTSSSTFAIGYADTNTLEIRHNGKTSNATQQIDITNHKSKWTMLVVTAYVEHDGKPALGSTFLYDLSTGEILAQRSSSKGTGAVISLTDPNAYIGYGEYSGGLNVAFSLTDFLVGVDIAEFAAIARSFDNAEIDRIAKGHLPESQFKSGFNSRPAKRFHQLLDAKRTYPISSNPGRPLTPASAFNDVDVPVFGAPPPVEFKETQPYRSFDISTSFRPTPRSGKNWLGLVTLGSTQMVQAKVPISTPSGKRTVGVLKASAGGWNLYTSENFLPLGKYTIKFKLAVNSSPFTPFGSGDKIHVRVLNHNDKIISQKVIELSTAFRDTDIKDLNDFIQTVEVDIRTEEYIIQIARIGGSVGPPAQEVFLWDFEIPIERGKLMFPEMLPAKLFSGSIDAYGYETLRGAPGDTRPFFRDIHNTPFDKRLVAPGFVRQAITHDETQLLNKSVRNSPVSISSDTEYLGGTLAPFDDSSVQARLYKTAAVDASLNTDFSQRIGDHVAIVIDLDPSEETTIGVERKPDGNPTGRITSMAYYNFDTKKWETAGKNNDFIVPGAITITTSSATKYSRNGLAGAGNEILIPDAEKELLRNSKKLFNNASVGFAGTSGFTIYPNLGVDALAGLRNRALPTSNYGFPRHKKYEPKSGQKIKMSDYISAPFILERVSFEYGAAIEESGPHSLGYKLPFISTANSEFMQLYPQTYHKVSRNQASLDLDAGDGQYDFSCVRRGEFINGSKVVNLGDSEYGFAGDSDSSFTSAKSNQINMIVNSARIGLVSPETIGVDSFDDLGYFATYPGTAESPGVTDGASTQIKFMNKVAHPRFKPAFTAGRAAGEDYSLMTLTASMFLKASSGPRAPAEAPDKRNLTEVASSRSKPVSCIPVLAGGINGVVTGSWLGGGSSNLSIGDPALGILTNDADNGSDDTNRSWYSSEGGTPFWRADTFFLLKEKNKPDTFLENPIKIVASSWAPMYCQAPYMTEQSIRNSGDLGGANEAVYSQFRVIGSGQSASVDRDLIQMFRYGARTSTNLLLQRAVVSGNSDVDSLGNVTIDVGSKSSSTRELITFGQMVHYGYANAPTEITASLVDRVDVYTAGDSSSPAGMSGSIDTDFKNEIFDTPNDAPLNVSLHTQALKVANLFQGFNYNSIPSNLEHVYDPTKGGVSLLSDFPDTCQAQYGSMHDPQDAGKVYHNRLSPKFGGFADDYQLLVSNTDLSSELRRPKGAPHPRYAVSGSASALDPDSVAFSDRRYNETFQGLDTFTVPIVTTTNSGDRPGSNFNSTAKFAAFYLERGTAFSGDTVPTTDPLTTGRPTPTAEPTYGSLYYSPAGSGWSLISSPAYIASTTRLNTNFMTGSMAEDFARFGSFTTSSIVWGKNLGQRFESAPTSTWLEAGLERDLNIFLKPGQTHQGTNPDFSDNFCGFTILTASTLGRPLESPGRESASSPLVANVYKRQYLNYREDFKLDVPVRTDVPRSAEAPGYWTFTANNYRTEIAGAVSDEQTYLGKLARTDSFGSILAANSTVTADNRLFTAQRMLYAKRYHLRYSVVVSEGGWNSGFMEGVKNYARAVGAGVKIEGKEQSSLPLPGFNVFTAGPRESNNGSSPTKTFSIDNNDDFATGRSPQTRAPYSGILASTVQSGSFVKEPTVDSMYVLDPTDELVLGVQPSLPGWNPGSGLPNNRHSSKYGIWDVSGSHTAGHAKTWDVGTSGQVMDDPYMNLEDPYEPCHGLTMLKSPSRIVLFGSFARDNKPHDNSSTQVIGSDAIHEALHYDNPVLDQFSIAGRDEYAGSGLEQHVTGTMAATGPTTTAANAAKLRGVANKISDGSMFFSGSLSRTLRIPETSEVFFDTLMHDPFGIAEADGGQVQSPVGASPGSTTLVQLHMLNSRGLMISGSAFLDALEFSGIRTAYAFSTSWANSFPFEPKYSTVVRLTSNQLAFGGTNSGTTIRLHPTRIGPQPLSSRSGTNSVMQYNLLSGKSAQDIALGFSSGSNDLISDEWYDLRYIPSNIFLATHKSKTPLDPAAFIQPPGIGIAGVSNMALVKEVNYSRTSTSQQNTTNPASREQQRTFFAAMIGYGRSNRKQLDISRQLRFTYITEKFQNEMCAIVQGAAIFDHPAGFKYGYMNSDHLNPAAVFRSDRYGQFRDMLEPRLYSKTFSFESDLSPAGETEAAVSCIFVDRSGTPVEDATLTSCLNISTAMTASKPFIEGDTPRKLIINPDFVSINPFSIDLTRLTDLV